MIELLINVPKCSQFIQEKLVAIWRTVVKPLSPFLSQLSAIPAKYVEEIKTMRKEESSVSIVEDFRCLQSFFSSISPSVS